MTLQDVTPGPRSEEFDAWVESAVQLWDRFNEGEYEVTPVYLDPEIEIQDLRGLPDREWHRGFEGVGRWAGKLLEIGTNPRIEILDFLPVDQERLLFEAIFRAEFGKRSELNMPVEVRVFPLVTMRDGKFRRMALFAKRNEALEAAGLRE